MERASASVEPALHYQTGGAATRATNARRTTAGRARCPKVDGKMRTCPSERSQTLLEGGAFFESPRWHEGRWWVSDFYRHLVLPSTRTAPPRSSPDRRGPAVGARLDARRPAARRLDARPPHPALDGRRRATLHADVSEHCCGHLNDMVVDGTGAPTRGTSASTSWAVPTRPRRPDPGRSRRQASVAADDLLPQRLGHHARRAHAHRRRDRRRPLHRVHDRGRRHVTTAASGHRSHRRRSSRRSRRRWASCRSGPTAVRSTPKATSGSADEVGARCVRLARAARSSTRSPPEGLDFFACMLGGDDGRTLLMCAAPDFGEQTRSAAPRRCSSPPTVDVPHAGLP